MDIPVNPWEINKPYQVNDIVKVGNLALYQPFMQVIITDKQFVYGNDEEPIQTDQEAVFITDYNQEQDAPFDNITMEISDEVSFGYDFPASGGKGIGFSLSAMVKKFDEKTKLKDEYKTYLTTDARGNIDKNKSIGVGIGIKFYDRQENEIKPSDPRKAMRAMASSELSHNEYYNVVLDISPEDVPKNASSAGMFLFTYGLEQGEGAFMFRAMSATNTNPFFYCIKDHVSTFYIAPNNDGGIYWTQDFVWRPSYNSKSNFVAINEEMKMGEGQDYVTNASINSLPMEISLSFENRTDKEARAIVHFLQEKYFAYSSIFSLNYDGNRLLSTEVQSFRFDYTFPYKKDLNYVCTDFNHDIPYRNKNNIQAKFICNTESVLSSVESHAGYDDRLDALVPIFIDEETEFKKGEQITLNTFSLQEGEGTTEITDVDKIEKYPQNAVSNITHGKVTFVADKDLEVGGCIYIEVRGPNDSIFNIGKTKIVEKLTPNEYVFSPVKSSGNDNELSANDVVFKKMTVCPEDCSYTKVLLPEGVESIPAELTDPETGETRKRQVYLKNYRKVQIDSDIYADTSSVTFTPLENFTMQANDDFWLLISAVRGRHSIYLKDPDLIPKYPWLEIRNLDHHASLSFSINHTPKHIQTDFTKYYNRRFKKEINQNLSTFNIVFDKRSDEEAAEILQFLESHLGYKKFRFQMPRPYTKDSETWTTPVREYTSTFYCPSWEHTVVYKNNHTISATLIESTTSISEDLRDVFGIGREEKRPCYGAEVYDPITTHELCTFSPVLMAAGGTGFDPDTGEISSTDKSVDIIFVVDCTGSMTQRDILINGVSVTKFEAVVDLIIKMVTGYDVNKYPGTNDYRNLWDSPDFEFNSVDGDNNIPPWPADPDITTSLISKLYDENKGIEDLLKNNKYNIENLERFKIKIEKSKVNLGLIFMGPSDQNDHLIIPISKYPTSFDKIEIYKKIKPIKDKVISDSANRIRRWHSDRENSPRAISSALAEFYNSPRAENVSERIILMLSDATFTSPDTTDWLANYPDTWSVASLKMCESLRGGELSKRRPSDHELKKYGFNEFTPFNALEKFKTQEKHGGQSYYNHADKGEENPEWYNEIVPTVFMLAKVGSEGHMSAYSANYVYDYDGDFPNPGPFNKKYQFHFDLSLDPGSESQRMMELISVVERLTSDTGYQNIFSIVLYNCGPHDVRLKNTIFAVKSQSGSLKYTTEFLNAGVSKGGSVKNLQYSLSSEDINNIQDGYGGQFYGDANNQNLLDKEQNDSLLWESFNTKYEVYRDGKIHPVGGGWGANSSESLGVKNTGVAFKGMPVRVFKTDNGLDIIDYNIGNVSQANQYKGDYSHLPVIKTGEKLDLFFGTRVNTVAASSEEVQLVINSESVKNGSMDCYANYNFNINVPVKKDTVGKNQVQKTNLLTENSGKVQIAGYMLGGIQKFIFSDSGANAAIGLQDWDIVFQNNKHPKFKSTIININPGETITFKNFFKDFQLSDSNFFGMGSHDGGFGSIAATENVRVEFWLWPNFGEYEGLKDQAKVLDKVGPFVLNQEFETIAQKEFIIGGDPHGVLQKYNITIDDFIGAKDPNFYKPNGDKCLNGAGNPDSCEVVNGKWAFDGYGIYASMFMWSRNPIFDGSIRITHLG
jgi:phage-related protein